MNAIKTDMTEKQSKILIIDASVARAAGSEDAVKPVPKQCREFLIEVFEICHKVGITDGIKEEWYKHALSWLTYMKSRGKLKEISSKQNASLRDKIASEQSTPENIEAMKKDTILIEAAIVSDGLIISRDEIARELFQDLSLRADELKKICWINPTFESENPIQWLKDGAKKEKERTFDYRRKKKMKKKKVRLAEK